jgi:hypothetical protein
MSVTKTKELLVMTIKQEQAPTLEKIDGTLKGMQFFVGGLIEIVGLGFEDYLIVCNEEGKMIDGLKPTLSIGHDVIMGDCFICKDDNEGELVSLTGEDFAKLMKMFSQSE